MYEPLDCISLNIHTTTKCTLKCAKCGWSFPYFENEKKANVKKTIAALDMLFQVYGHIHEVRFGGAEAFLYPDIEKMIEAISAYRNQFDYAIIITNGTYLPRQSILETIKKMPYPFLVRVDNYGNLSKKYEVLIEVLKKNNIDVDERIYSGEDQAFGGWVYYGDYSYRDYTSEELEKVFHTCRLPDDCIILIDNILMNCPYVAAGDMLGKVQLEKREYVNLLSDIGIEKMREIILQWKDEPFEACKYCNGFDPINSPRIPAAEQIR